MKVLFIAALVTLSLTACHKEYIEKYFLGTYTGTITIEGIPETGPQEMSVLYVEPCSYSISYSKKDKTYKIESWNDELWNLMRRAKVWRDIPRENLADNTTTIVDTTNTTQYYLFSNESYETDAYVFFRSVTFENNSMEFVFTEQQLPWPVMERWTFIGTK